MPRYSILNETLPYIARRILSDPSPRTAGALETFVFGEAKEDRQSRVLDAERVGTLLNGARRYSAAAALAADDADARLPQSATARAEAAADALLDLLAEDTPASRIVLEQLVLVLGASSRQIWADLRARSGALQQRSVLGTLVDPLGLFRHSAFVRNGERDFAALQAVERLASLANELLREATPGGTPPSSDVAVEEIDQQQLIGALAAKAYQRRDDLAQVSRRLGLEALDQAANRLASGQARA